jgi:hypothetical protein
MLKSFFGLFNRILNFFIIGCKGRDGISDIKFRKIRY